MTATTYTAHDLEQFVASMLETAMWSTSDPESLEDGSLGQCYQIADLERITRQLLEQDAKRFLDECCHLITLENYQGELNGHTPMEMAGRDFWLTRCGHGAGFWDGGWRREAGEALTGASFKAGNVRLYVGPGRQVYA